MLDELYFDPGQEKATACACLHPYCRLCYLGDDRLHRYLEDRGEVTGLVLSPKDLAEAAVVAAWGAVASYPSAAVVAEKEACLEEA